MKDNITLEQLMEYIDNKLLEQDLRIEELQSNITALKRKLLYGEAIL